MFTSEPTLIQRIERMIRDTTIVDPHSHIRCEQPSVPDLASLLSHHEVQTDLNAVGQPVEDRALSLPAEERVRRAIPYLRKMRNTCTAWTFYRILRDLFDFYEPNLTDSNYREVMDKVATVATEPNWASHVLQQRCNMETLVTGLGNKSEDATKQPAHVKYFLDASYLFCPGVPAAELSPFFHNRNSKTEYYEALTAILGAGIDNPDVLERRLHDWLDQTVTSDVKFTHTLLPIEQRFHEPDDTAAAKVLNRAASGGDVDPFDADILAEFVSYKTLEWHHLNRKTLQIAVGSDSSLPGGKSIPRFQGSWSSDMARAFARFGNVKFDIMLASDVLTSEVAVLARMFPNVYVSGDWSHTAFPPMIEKNLAERLQVTPMSKFAGFLSDAPYAEWTYGKLQVVSKATAAAFAHLIDSGYYEEYEVPTMLQQILYHTPREVYGLG